MSRWVRISTGSRLHFGFFALAASSADKRAYGGAGAMIETPACSIVLRAADRFSVTGPEAARVQAAVRTWVAGNAMPCCAIEVESAPYPHVGLGTGTQLALAVCRALAIWQGQPAPCTAALARGAGRARRSAIGLHGFDRGGFVVEAGRLAANDEPGPLVFGAPVPAAWRFVLAIPRGQQGLSGDAEAAALASAPRVPVAVTAELARLALLHIAPALLAADAARFGAALYDFNHRVGEMFSSVQGGAYATLHGAQLVARLRSWGVEGVGQSSWGPTVFALAENADQAHDIADRLRASEAHTAVEVLVSAPRNRAAEWECQPATGC